MSIIGGGGGDMGALWLVMFDFYLGLFFSICSHSWPIRHNWYYTISYFPSLHPSKKMNVFWCFVSQVKLWDTMAPPSSGSSSCVGSTHLSTNSAPIAVKCHESLCYIAAGSEVTTIDLRTMKKASVLALRDHRILSCEMLPSEWLICTGIKNK